MPGQVDICNMALSAVGTRSTIASLREASTEAEQCAIHFMPVLKGLLRAHLWGFAKRQIPLALLLAASGTQENPNSTPPFPPSPWSYEYAYPADCVRIRSIIPPVDVSPYPSGVVIKPGTLPSAPFGIGIDSDQAGNPVKVIVTNQQRAILNYTMRVDDPNLWETDFTEAFVNLLAARLCGPLTGDKTLAAALMQAAKDQILIARCTDGTETPVNPSHIPDWIQDRGYAWQEQFEDPFGMGTQL